MGYQDATCLNETDLSARRTALFDQYDVIQFLEHHKWCGCYGFISEVRITGSDVKYMIGVPTPMKGTAYIFSLQSNRDFEYIGRSVLIPMVEDEEE